MQGARLGVPQLIQSRGQFGFYGALLPIFYQDYLGLTAGWIGLASIIYGIWNAINDPLFGYITDSTRSKRAMAATRAT